MAVEHCYLGGGLRLLDILTSLVHHIFISGSLEAMQSVVNQNPAHC